LILLAVRALRTEQKHRLFEWMPTRIQKKHLGFPYRYQAFLIDIYVDIAEVLRLTIQMSAKQILGASTHTCMHPLGLKGEVPTCNSSKALSLLLGHDVMHGLVLFIAGVLTAAVLLIAALREQHAGHSSRWAVERWLACKRVPQA
jgi:hypothetical protein